MLTEPEQFVDFDVRSGELYAGLCGGTRPLADGPVPAAFGADRPPPPAVSVPVIAETGTASGTVTWLIPVGGAAVAIGAVALAVRHRRRATS